ncbi:MAG TPA: biotin carboxylase N-terminal domain-containing protein [Streptosporangiaceae bacterium]|nr:biotin carboxylase N-terminal domain-containing protein [Streptosporangiaceae bacterium]
MTQITRLMVANRGEIARRVFRTCRQLGIGTVAVYSDPDAGSPHVAEADLAVRLPGATSAKTYLNAGALIEAARAAGADAVHPGYGFGSEDPEFARRVLAAGLLWVGPPPEAMAAMALKIQARERAADAGLPVLSELDPGSVTEFPVLVKASAGGGGRGMRAVHSAAELAEAIESARREALSAFGDGTVFCEPLLAGARHIEVQVLADSHGTVWALTERDCSTQRRYAKVIEETPAPAFSAELRSRLLAAATALAKAVGYAGAGTVEFLVGGLGTSRQDEFYFLEFNTRLQVEHPVTECVHGIDLVALQLAIAEGHRLPASPPPADGHAIEARLYAEDPAEGFRPSAGPVHAFAVPDVDSEFGLPAGPARGPLLRLDAGVVPGTGVSPHYDAMLAKVIAWAPDRQAAIRRLAAGLRRAVIAGPATNRDLLVSVLRNPAFADHGADTSMLDGYDYASLVPDERACELAAAAATAAVAAANRLGARIAPGVPGGWRNVPSQLSRTSFTGPHGQIDVAYRWTRRGIVVGGGTVGEGTAVTSAAPDRVELDVSGVRHRFGVTRAGADLWIHSGFGSVKLTLLERLPGPERAADPGSLIAPMPGSVTKIAASAGDTVTAGQAVLVVEAMKMEHQIMAPATGLLTELRVSVGAQVNAGEVLAIVQTDQE